MTTSAIRQALVEHLGQVLTPDVAAALEMAATAPVDRTIDPQRFGARQHGEYTIAAEPFLSALPELHPLHEIHWLETERYRHGLALRPDYPAMAAMERNGRAIQFTVRRAGELVGNLRVYLGTSLHTQTTYASEDTLFLLPEHRGSFLVVSLMRFAEAALRVLDVREFRVNSKLVNRSDVLMRRLGYQPVALQFVKFFKE